MSKMKDNEPEIVHFTMRDLRNILDVTGTTFAEMVEKPNPELVARFINTVIYERMELDISPEEYFVALCAAMQTFIEIFFLNDVPPCPTDLN